MPIQQLPPKNCFDLREADPTIVHVDVRTPEEFAAGHPRGALNVPIFLRGPGGMRPNAEFLDVVTRVAAKETRVICSCAMGGRSQRACEVLEGEGYKLLVNMTGGFSGARDENGDSIEQGWIDAGLPVSRELEDRGWDTLRARAKT